MAKLCIKIQQNKHLKCEILLCRNFYMQNNLTLFLGKFWWNLQKLNSYTGEFCIWELLTQETAVLVRYGFWNSHRTPKLADHPLLAIFLNQYIHIYYQWFKREIKLFSNCTSWLKDSYYKVRFNLFPWLNILQRKSSCVRCTAIIETLWSAME